MLLAAATDSDFATFSEFAALPRARGEIYGYLDAIWQRYFADVPRANNVEIAYCQPWKSRLGLIRMTLDESSSFIGINALLQHPHIPEFLLITTIAHEMVHYAHGFGSPLPRRYEHPHADDVVDRELEKRGLKSFVQLTNAWIDKHWFPFYDMQRRNGWAGIPKEVSKRKIS
jgi:hypothetical protein